MCYIHTTADLTLKGYVGDKMKDLEVGLWSDADCAGDRTDWHSTNGAYLAGVGPSSHFPLFARSKKQSATSMHLYGRVGDRGGKLCYA